ncbi:MAG: hypothetical protein R3C68_08020 [Myxococcota bacterium]
MGEGDLNRALAIDADGDVWAGNWRDQGFWELNADTGEVKRWVALGISAYGAVIDGQGILWAPSNCCGTGSIRSINTSSKTVVIGSQVGQQLEPLAHYELNPGRIVVTTVSLSMAATGVGWQLAPRWLGCQSGTIRQRILGPRRRDWACLADAALPVDANGIAWVAQHKNRV